MLFAEFIKVLILIVAFNCLFYYVYNLDVKGFRYMS